MKIVIAPDSYKGSMSSIQVSDRIEAGIGRVMPGAEIVKIPIAERGGGNGGLQRYCERCGIDQQLFVEWLKENRGLDDFLPAGARRCRD